MFYVTTRQSSESESKRGEGNSETGREELEHTVLLLVPNTRQYLRVSGWFGAFKSSLDHRRRSGLADGTMWPDRKC